MLILATIPSANRQGLCKPIEERQGPPVNAGLFDGIEVNGDPGVTPTAHLATLIERLTARHVSVWLEESSGRVKVKGLAILTDDEQSELHKLSEPIRVYLTALETTADLDAQPPSDLQDAPTADEATGVQATGADATDGKSRGKDRRIFRPPTLAVPPPWCSNLPPSITGAVDGGAILL